MMAYALIGFSVALLVFVLWATRRVGERLNLDAETQRKTVHIALGLYCLTFPILFDEPWQVAVTCGLAVLLLIAMRTGRRRSEGLGKALHAVNRETYGEVFFAAAVALLFYLKRDIDVLYLLPIAILTLADAAAALVGTHYGRRLFDIEAGVKSYEGVTIFFLVSWIIAVGMILHFTGVFRENVLLLGLTVAMFGATIEAESWQGWDNLFVPLGLYFFLEKYLLVGPLELAYAAGIFIFMLLGALWTVQRFNADAHTARVATIVFFCIWMNAGPINIGTPIAALVAFIFLERRRKSSDDFPELRAVLAIIGIGLVWFVFAQLSGYNGIFLFHLSYGLVAAALIGMAFWPHVLTIFLVTFIVWLIASLRLWLGERVDPLDLFYIAVAYFVMVFAAIGAALARSYLDRHRARRLTISALAVAAPFFFIAKP
ncbi:MAG: hypothetical protein OEQ29_05070 [Alphaproteobacteria bacterium]|nr:hypothetical protein [Alphaproteobacteria bacterium]